MKQSKDEGSVFDKLVYFFPLNTTKVHAVLILQARVGWHNACLNWQ